ncbi:hypothetical protein P691DRAFT_688274, partial [Macrolepiota fuliginosa MF-IS2]
FLRTSYILLYQRKYQHHKKTTLALLIYLCITFSFLTAFTISNLFIKTRSFVDFRDYPGGPVAYMRAIHASPPAATVTVTAFFVNYLTDILLLYRCYVVFRDKIWVVCLLFLPFLATTGLGLTLLCTVSHSTKTLWNTVDIGLPYFIISSASNIIVTALIATRLLLQRRRINAICPQSYGRVYLTASAVLIESCALNAIVSASFLIPYGIGNSLSYLVVSMWTQVQFIASCLVIYRIAKKQAWSRRLTEQLSTRAVNVDTIITSEVEVIA